MPRRYWIPTSSPTALDVVPITGPAIRPLPTPKTSSGISHGFATADRAAIDDLMIEELRDIMARLRDPATGCPWDVQQDFASIAPYTIEEAYEVADAIQRGDMAALRD